MRQILNFAIRTYLISVHSSGQGKLNLFSGSFYIY
jgi:hypothetical protein